MLVGDMRVASDRDRQTTALQRDALLAASVDERHLYEDKASGITRFYRNQFSEDQVSNNAIRSTEKRELCLVPASTSLARKATFSI